MLEKGQDSLLKECCNGNFYKLTPEDIYRSALEGTPFEEVLREAGRALGVGLANIINILSPRGDNPDRRPHRRLEYLCTGSYKRGLTKGPSKSLPMP